MPGRKKADSRSDNVLLMVEGQYVAASRRLLAKHSTVLSHMIASNERIEREMCADASLAYIFPRYPGYTGVKDVVVEIAAFGHQQISTTIELLSSIGSRLDVSSKPFYDINLYIL